MRDTQLAGQLLQATSDWHPSSQTSGSNPTVPLCTGCDAPYPSACSVPPSSAYVVHDLQGAMCVKLSPVDLMTAEASLQQN